MVGVFSAENLVIFKNVAPIMVLCRLLHHHPFLLLQLGGRPTQCLALHLSKEIMAMRPFVFPSVGPSGQESTVVSASRGTTGNSAQITAAGCTSARSVVTCTQGVSATSGSSGSSNKINKIEENFNPLPLNIVSPIKVDVLEKLLKHYPCPGSRDYLVSGFRYGFDIGFRGSFEDPNSRPRNLLSARNNVEQVSEAIVKELSRGHTSGPFPHPPFIHTHCSPIGSAPKPDGSVRLILDLSSPRGQSVNDGISKEEFTCKYSKFDDAVSIVLHLGKGAYLGKIDIKHAFRICPVMPEQWPLLCFEWLGQFFTDTRLPFGSRSSPFIFNTFAVALAWIVLNVGRLAFLIHYLDDFFLANRTKNGCRADMDVFLKICRELGVPIAEDKTEGPATRIVYLGIEIDTEAMTLRLPSDKLKKVKDLIKEWSGGRKCTKRELLSLIGFLAFVCKVVKPGRIFLRRLIDLSTSVSSLNHFIYLNKEARADIAWWETFFPSWHGVEIIHPPSINSIDLQLYSDASDIGLGCVYGSHWVCARWPPEWAPSRVNHINVRELFAVWVAVLTWGDEWANREVVIFSDNKAAIEVWTTGSCSDSRMMSIIRAIFFRCAQLNLNLLLSHVPGKDNVNADLLSRLQVEEFRQINPTADKYPTTIREEAWTLHGTA